MSATFALIPAAGRGARFSTDAGGEGLGNRAFGNKIFGNKVFAPLCGRPLLRWTVEAFDAHADIDGIVVVAAESEAADCRALLAGLGKVRAVVPGGRSRQESVAIGLAALDGAPDDVVLVHDGARPLITGGVIDRCVTGAREKGNAVAATPVADTLKRVKADQTVAGTIRREALWAVQTPQAFRFGTLRRAHAAARDKGFLGTDEASLVEQLRDEPIYLVPGAPDNLKVTHRDDLALAEAILRDRIRPAAGETRIGFGYDIHRLVVGRKLILGGVEIREAQGRGLDGHSDADVLLHALCDALLGAAALPDIGTLFPNTDAAWEGIASTRLLGDVAARVTALGFRVVNVDATVIAEVPRIGPAIPQMRAAIARILHLDPTRIGIKATTHEGLGALGQGAGIAAHAVASLVERGPSAAPG